MTALTETDEGLIGSRADPGTFGQYASGGRWVPYSYQRYIARRIASARARGDGRLIVNLPSRHGKSELCSLWTPAWLIDSLPEQKVILASYGAELAENWGRAVRNEFDQNLRLMTPLRDDSQAANRWNTPEGGGMLAVGVGGSVIGFGGDLILVDDPHKDWAEAHSVTIRDRTVDWFGSTLYSRLEPHGTIVVLQQRLNEEDLSGYLIEKHADPWEVIRLPALAEEGDLLGRKPGQALCPQRYDETALAQIRRGMNPLAWDAMYQQRPLGVGSGRVYHRFTPDANEDKTLRLRHDLPLQMSLDFNVNPGMHVEIGQYDSRIDCFSCVHEIHGPRMKLEPALTAFERLVKDVGGFRWPRLEVYGDATGSSERAETTESAYAVVRRRLDATGWRYTMHVPAANPPIIDRVAAFNDALKDGDGQVHYKVNPLNCPRLMADLKWLKEDEQGLIDKKDAKLSHGSDAEGYRVWKQRPLLEPTEVATGGFYGAVA